LDFMTGMLVLRPWIGKSLMCEAIRAHFSDRDRFPSPSTVNRWMHRTRENIGFVAATNPAKFKNSFRVAFGSYSEGINQPNALWELDSTPADVLLKEGRFHVLGCVDVFSRRAMVVVSKTSRAVAIALLLRKCLLEWGVPAVVKTDNGKDFVSLHVTRVLADLGVEHRVCVPFQPWQKPHIERFFRTFSHGVLELLPGFAGHNVAERMAIRDRAEFGERLFKRDSVVEFGEKLSADEFQEFCDRWVEGVYLHEPHWGLDGVSPWVKWSSFDGRLRVISDVRALDVLLAPTSGNGVRRVGKQGVRVEGVTFVSPLLVDRVGERVQVRFDPADLGVVFIFDLMGVFVCEAVCPERLGISRAEVAVEANRLQREKVGKERRQLRAAARKVKSVDVVAEVLDGRSRQSDKLLSLPREVVEFESHALTQAGRAAIAGEALKSNPPKSPKDNPPHNKAPLGLAPETLVGERVRSLWLNGRAAEISHDDLRLVERFCFSGDRRAALRFRLAFFGRDECDQFFQWLVPVLRGLPPVDVDVG
ncbi:MAG: Mu transposase C-terminal domain-containing protein, partial [Cyanobacteria bacterium P01_H01_bin.130]